MSTYGTVELLACGGPVGSGPARGVLNNSSQVCLFDEEGGSVPYVALVDARRCCSHKQTTTTTVIDAAAPMLCA
jgi:hypothetical protein